MVGMFVAVLVGGPDAFKQLNRGYPDPTPPMVDIVTQSPGLSSEEIERYITIPIETQVAASRSAYHPTHLVVRLFRRQNCSSPSTTPMTRRCSRC